MDSYFIYQPMADGETPKITIADLIPKGRENAISRANLTRMCQRMGLINNTNDADRQMRLLLQKARIDYTILNRAEGGYYRPTADDLQDLRRYICQERKRAKAIFKDIQHATRLYNDYEMGRLLDEE